MAGQAAERGLNWEVREAMYSLGILSLSSSGLGDVDMKPVKNDLSPYSGKIGIFWHVLLLL